MKTVRVLGVALGVVISLAACAGQQAWTPQVNYAYEVDDGVLYVRWNCFAEPPGLVADGRDMGSVIFPAAPLKVFLTASAAERALRRHKQLKEKGVAVNLADLSREIEQRDRQDATRSASPLKAAGDAVHIDSTTRSAADVVEAIWQLGVARGLWPAA